MNQESSEDLIYLLSINNPSYQKIFNQRLGVVKQIKKHMDQHERILLVSHDIRSPQSATIVTLEKLYPNFVLGYVINKLTNIRIPYTINYTSIISHEYSVESVWEGDVSDKNE